MKNTNLPEVVRREVAISSDFEVPSLVLEGGSNARYAWEEFIYGEISNLHTRRAYGKAVSDLLARADESGLTLTQITPKFVRAHLDKMETSIPTKKLRLAGIRHFFDIAVTRHAMLLNPALSVRGEKYSVHEGRTPEISINQAQKLLKSISEDSPIGMRDKLLVAILTYTAVRVGALSKLTVKDFQESNGQFHLKFREKGSKARDIPVRDDLEKLITRYLENRGEVTKKDPLFPSAIGRTGTFAGKGMHPDDIRRMLKRRFAEAGLPRNLSPHSFRVCAITDLLSQDVPREDVQYFAGHADARTTDLYDRRKKKVSRNIVERISVKLS